MSRPAPQLSTCGTLHSAPTAAFLLMLALLGLYRLAPNIEEQKLRWLLPGSVFAAIVWMVASVLFKLYVRHISDFGLLYGSLGTLIILMFWFYLSGVVILAGGEINAILEDAARQTQDSRGEKARAALTGDDARLKRSTPGNFRRCFEVSCL